MSFSQELKDFLSSAQAVDKLTDDTPKELRKAQIRRYNSLSDATDKAASKDGAVAAGNQDLLDRAEKAGSEYRGQAPAGGDYAAAIAKIETGAGGNYNAVGPATRTGDRAYGKFQVMGANIPVWTKEVLGQEMTPQQFLANPEAQEKVFSTKFGQYVKQYGNPHDAASMWFTGKPLAQGANHRAMDPNGRPYGLTGQEYVNQFAKNLGPRPPAAAAQTPPAVTPPAVPATAQPPLPPRADLQQDGALPVQYGSSGGMIKRYAEGGAVEGEEDTPDRDAAYDLPLAPEEGGAHPSIVNAAYDAVREGLTHTATRLGLHPAPAVSDPNHTNRAAAYARGDGAADHSQMEQVRRAVDPKGELTETERNLLALGTVYNHFNANGETEKAKKAAAGMMQYLRVASERHAALAQAHVEAGDLDGGIKNAQLAYANCPDGKDVKIVKQGGNYACSVTDAASGKVITKVIESPQQIAARIMGWRPGNFDKMLMAAAGEREAQKQGPSDQLKAGVGALNTNAPPATPSAGDAPPAPAAPPAVDASVTPPAPPANESGGDDEDGEGGDQPDNAAPAAGGMTPAVKAARNRGPAPNGPKFDYELYTSLPTKEQKVYKDIYERKHADAWAAHDATNPPKPKPAKEDKPASLRDTKEAKADIKDAWGEHIDEATPEGGKAPDVPKPVVKDVHNAATHVFLDKANRKENITAREALDTASQLALALPVKDPKATAEMQTKNAPGGKIVRMTPSSRPVFIPETEFQQLMYHRNVKLAAIKKAEEDAKKPSAVGGIVDAAVKGWNSGTIDDQPAVPSPYPTDRAIPRAPLPVFRTPGSIPLSQAPPGSIPQQSPGER